MSAYRRVVLASRPVGAPTLDNFRLETGPMPAPAHGQLLVRTLYLSLDPYMRGRMSIAPSYAQPVAMRAYPSAVWWRFITGFSNPVATGGLTPHWRSCDAVC